MKYLFTLLFVLPVLFTNAQGKLLSAKELEAKANEIKTEALILYRSERASWLGTDIMMERFTGDKSSIKGYFSYPEGAITKCLFYNADNKVLGTVSFDNIIIDNEGKYDGTLRDFTAIEKQYFDLRAAAVNALQADTTIKMYNNTTLNIVCVIDDNRKDVYVLTATSSSGVVLFGNDYLLRFDKSLKLIMLEPLHKSLIRLEYPAKEGNTMGMIHTHLPEFSPFITATDICTAMLYKDIAQNDAYTTVSESYFSVWHCGTNTLVIAPLPPKSKDK